MRGSNFMCISVITFFLSSMSSIGAIAAASPWNIKVIHQACVINNPYVSDCNSYAWVYDRINGDIYLCRGVQHSSGGPKPATITVKLSCEKTPIPVAGGVELEANGLYVTRWDEIWNFAGTKIGAYTNFVWVAGQLISDLRVCHTSRPVICSGQPVIQKPIEVRSEGEALATQESLIPSPQGESR